MTIEQVPNGEQQFCDGNGVPYALGTVGMYIPTTLTDKITWKDPDKVAQNVNPILLDAAGRCVIWGGGEYRQILKDVIGNTIWDKPVTVEDFASIGVVYVGTVGNLKALDVTGLVNGQVVYLKGYYAAGDGGQGNFLVTTSNPGADNGGTIIHSTTAGYYFVRQYSGPLNLRWFGAKGDGSNDKTKIQAWHDAALVGASGFIPAAQPGSYYMFDGQVNLSKFISIYGEGLASRWHYTGAGLAIDANGLRFTQWMNWYLTGTIAATGGVYFRSCQEGLNIIQFFTDGFNKAGAFAWRFSSCWTLQLLGGAARQSDTGILFDAVSDSVSGVNNSINVMGVNCSACGIGIDYQSGSVANFIGNDFSNDGGFITPIAAIELGRGVGGSIFVDSVNIIGNYGENVGAGYRIGRDNTSSTKPRYVNVTGNRADFAGQMLRIYSGDLNTVGENNWGAGTCVIDANVTRTNWNTVQPVTDNSTVGNTTSLRNSSVEAPQVIARGLLASGMNRLNVHRNAVNQVIGNGAPVKVLWTTEALDDPAAFDLVLSRWTPTKPGWYWVEAHLTYSTMADGNMVVCAIYKNGTSFKSSIVYAGAAGNPSVEVKELMQFNGTTDYVEIFTEHNNGGNKDLIGAINASWMSASPGV